MQTIEIPRREVAILEADPNQGLTSQQAQERLDCGWGNRVKTDSGKTEKEIILQNSLTFFNMVFVVLAVLMLLVGSSVLNLTFMVVVLVNTAIGCIQEIRAKRAVDKLTLVAAQKLRTVRDGKVIQVRSDLLVRDDIVEYHAGDQICADGIVCMGEIQVNESLITGEADAIIKKDGDVLKSGSFVVAGTGRARLTQVGNDSFAAKLSMEAKADPKATKSEMMRSLDKLIKFIGFALIPVGLLLFWNQMVGSESGLRASVEGTVAALVGMIPEGLYLLTSVAMAVSAIKLTRKRVLVQDMNCIETLARVDVLCVDKTGTITEPVMEVENVIPLGSSSPEYLEQVLSALYGTREPDNDTARAISELFPGPSQWECTRYIPFTSQTKWSGGVFEGQGAFLVGAPEFILGDGYGALQEQIEPWSSTGHRVLLVAKYHAQPQPGALDAALIEPMALIALTNRIRPEAPETFRYFAQQGVTIKVISGDNPATVSAVALRAGIQGAEHYIDTGSLHSPEDFLEAVDQYTVFGRVTPDQKKKLIKALKQQGHTVAMTGDGVNDVLAMKESDCGIAMASGAQAASQVARLVLLDSDFSAMPHIVGEGRRVINNIQRAAALFLVKNIFSLGLALLTLVTSLRFPLESFHFSIMSSLTIGLPGFFLAMEPNYERVTGKFLPKSLRKAFPGGLTNILVVLTAQAFMAVFQLPAVDGQSISTAILCMVGVIVLIRVCQPFTKMRKAVCIGSAVLVVGAFLVLPPVTGYLQITKKASWLILLATLVMVPTVSYAMEYLFQKGDELKEKLKNRKKNKDN
ncbi:MAG: HAD family hydrolase [Ruminococcaceae bacterium]|nr:HAD family hydrolase [Oscillospiraceae bacterium]